MKLFAHSPHVYEDRGARVFVEFAAGQAREVTEAVGSLLLAAHPLKFCDVTGGVHKCKKAALYQTTQLAPEHKTVMLPQGRSSRRRQEARRQTYKRSRIARANSAARG